MVRKYKRKTNQHSWSLDTMKKAVQIVVSGEMGYKKAAQAYNIPQTTLERYVAKYRGNPDETSIKQKLGHYETVFTPDQETELKSYIKAMEERFYGLTSAEVRSLAFQLAEKNHIEHRFNAVTGMAGVDWLKSFLKRHPDISYRKPEATSAARAMGFNKIAVNDFFKLLETAIDKYQITPQNIYNVDETGISTVPKSHSKILASTGKRQVGTLTSAERGKVMTTIVCFSAIGSYMPPMFIFPRKRMKLELLDGAPAGSWGECHESGWIQGHLFLLWLKRFIKWAHATKDNPVLLLLDGHATHVKSIDVLDLARENGLVLLCFPPHCTHRLQPLDVGFMKPLSTYYSHEVKKWLRCHPGRVVTQFHIAALFGKAFVAAATMTTAINSFRATGVWPLDSNVFTDVDFAPAETTDNTVEPTAAAVTATTSQDTEIVNQTDQCNLNVSTDSTNDELETEKEASTEHKQCSVRQEPKTPERPTIPRSSSTQPGCSWMDNSPNSSYFMMSPKEIMPLPKEIRTTQRVSKRRGKTAIITESPYKNELLALKETKDTKEKKRKTTKQLVSDSKEKKIKKTKTIKKKNKD